VNIHFLVDFLKINYDNFDIVIIPEISNIIELIKSNNIFIYVIIYEDEIMCKLIYASQYYLTTMDKDKVIKYNKFKRERSLSDNEKLILDQVTNPFKK
jgi:hypothetical protein